jgi:tRNA (mo5U34)-methyltransferase
MGIWKGTLTRGSAAPLAPANFSPETVFTGICWHQRWEIFRGIYVPGINPVDTLCAAVMLPADLSGKRVLDIGAWNGCFSFECERRGAAEVVAVSLEDPDETGFNRLKRLLHSRVEYVNTSVYHLSPRELGTFDVILFFGVLYHLRYPLLAIDRIRGVSRGEVFIETHVIDYYPWLRGQLKFLTRLPFIGGALRLTPLWRQYRECELHPQDQSNWFGPNVGAVMEAFESAGFEIAPLRSWGDRASFHARACPIPPRLRHHTYEALEANTGLVGLNAAAGEVGNDSGEEVPLLGRLS